MLHILNDNIGDIQGDMEFVTSYGDSIENTDETVKVIDTKVKDIVASVDGIKNDTLEIIDTVTTMNTTLGNVTMMETLTGDAIVSNKYEEDIFSVGYSGIRHVSLTMNVLGLDQTNPRDDVSIGMLFDIHPGALDVVTRMVYGHMSLTRTIGI